MATNKTNNVNGIEPARPTSESNETQKVKFKLTGTYRGKPVKQGELVEANLNDIAILRKHDFIE